MILCLLSETPKGSYNSNREILFDSLRLRKKMKRKKWRNEADKTLESTAHIVLDFAFISCLLDFSSALTPAFFGGRIFKEMTSRLDKAYKENNPIWKSFIRLIHTHTEFCRFVESFVTCANTLARFRLLPMAREEFRWSWRKERRECHKNAHKEHPTIS